MNQIYFGVCNFIFKVTGANYVMTQLMSNNKALFMRGETSCEAPAALSYICDFNLLEWSFTKISLLEDVIYFWNGLHCMQYMLAQEQMEGTDEQSLLRWYKQGKTRILWWSFVCWMKWQHLGSWIWHIDGTRSFSLDHDNICCTRLWSHIVCVSVSNLLWFDVIFICEYCFYFVNS